MAIVGFDFRKMSAEKNDKSKGGKISINNNVTVKEVEMAEASIAGKGQKLLRYSFEFKSEYKPDLGNIKLEGEVLSLEEGKKAEELEKSWKKDKTLPPEVMQSVISTALNKCNVQALILSQQVNLPSPIPLPKVEAKAGKKK